MFTAKNQNKGFKPIGSSSGHQAFKAFDWTMAPIIAYDWLSNNSFHASNISVHLACFTVMVFAVKRSRSYIDACQN